MNSILIIGALAAAGYFLYTKTVNDFNEKLKEQEQTFDDKVAESAADTLEQATNYTDQIDEGNKELKKMQSYCYPTSFCLQTRADADQYWAYQLDVTFTNKDSATYYITNINVRNLNIGGNIVDGIFCSQQNKQYAISGNTKLTISKQITALLFDTKTERDAVKKTARGKYAAAKAVIDWDFASVAGERDGNVDAKTVNGTHYRGPATGNYGSLSKTWIKNGKIQ
ncbi:MAG: hypothetical protein ACI30B_07625 [Paludibacteraceae bacterium]